MPDFPLGLVEFGRFFSSEKACRDYLMRVRWPKGFRCPDCPGKKGYLVNRRGRLPLVECKDCRRQITLTAGTVMHKTKTSLCSWFLGAYFLATHTPGISAWQFRRHARVRRYETAFQMLHKMRALLRDEEPVAGTVEVDETYVGGRKAGKGGRGARGKAIVVAAVEVHGDRAGRLRLRKIPSASREHLHGFLRDAVLHGSTVVTDGWDAYLGMEPLGFHHVRRVEHEPERAAVVLPHVHRVFSNLKSWLIGTHHGVSRKHLAAYLNEFTYRFNSRWSREEAFQALLGLGAWQRGPTYKALYSGAWRHPNGQGAPAMTG